MKITEAGAGVSVKQFDSLKKGDVVTITNDSVMISGTNTLEVSSKDVVANGKVERITFRNLKHPTKAKHYLFKRKSGLILYSVGGVGSSVVKFVKEGSSKESYREETRMSLCANVLETFREKQ